MVNLKGSKLTAFSTLCQMCKCGGNWLSSERQTLPNHWKKCCPNTLLNNGEEGKAATWKAATEREIILILCSSVCWEIWHQCESEIDPMSPALAEKIRASGQARLGPILRGKAEEGAKEYRLTGTFAFSRSPINPKSFRCHPARSPFTALLTLTMFSEMIHLKGPLIRKASKLDTTLNTNDNADLKQTAALSQIMILSTPVYFKWPWHTVTQGHSQGTITLKQGQFGKQPRIDRSKLFHLVMMFEDILPIILLRVTSCQNIATVNSSVPDSWWSMWQSRRWCDTWDPDHGLEGALFPHPLLGLEWLFALRLVLGPDKRPFPSDTFSVHKNRQQCNPFSEAYIRWAQRWRHTEGNAQLSSAERWDWIYCPQRTLLLLLLGLIALGKKSFGDRFA